MAAINWVQIGQNIVGATSLLNSLGVAAAAQPGILAQIGLAQNPNASDELAICSQILILGNNPTTVSLLAAKLVTEVGLPPAAAAIAATLGQPGVDVTGKVMQIEALIKSNG